MKISLITTVYNEGSNIESFLDSIFNMNKLPDEIVIVDAGSTDETQNIIKDYQKKYKNINLIVKAKCNIAEGRNLAIRNARYEIIAVTDAGCVVSKKWLACLMSVFIDEEIDVASGWYEPLVRNKFEKLSIPLLFDSLKDIDKEAFLPSSRSIAFRKKVWEEIGGYPEFLTFAGEDTLFDRKLKKFKFKFEFCDEAIVEWEPRKNINQFIKQIYLYSLGDAEANNFNGMYSKKIISFGTVLFGILSSIFTLIFMQKYFGIMFLGTVSLMIYKYRKAIKKDLKLIVTTIPLCIVMELCQFWGYFQGAKNKWVIKKSKEYIETLK